jgi:hypothetical protein
VRPIAAKQNQTPKPGACSQARWPAAALSLNLANHFLARTLDQSSAGVSQPAADDDLETLPLPPEAHSSSYNFNQIPFHAKPPVRLQSNLTAGPPADVFEQEAGRVATQALARPEPVTITNAPRLLCAAAQPAQFTEVVPASVDQVLASPGRPLEQRFGCDFSRVRVHTGTAATQSAEAIHAKACTAGHDIVFGAGRFAPGTQAGRPLLAHELTHVVQGDDHRQMIRRGVQGNILQTSISPHFAKALTDLELQQQPDRQQLPFPSYYIQVVRRSYPLLR